MELLYQIKSIECLKRIDCINVRWIKNKDDFKFFQLHLSMQNISITIEDWINWSSNGIDYCGLFIDDKMVARAAVERYSDNKWETADVRVLPNYRKKGYGEQVVYFITKYILDNGKIATCRTNINNEPMKALAKNIGFSKYNL